ncbi:hypothetical protein K458DRAFT_463173 [Lentithecium fluviatile CBS 122367]|uniref:F-box domain-containing protein n=1 Tax=Lentithecium fluviatile CBS 122367 TaxID=1168545 RepID=A0A6G1ILB8_9PLEO|nr:hypothetical protein K458DRAFT_463173 [Lentithecium fluviatile CBS 122367]
MMRETTETFPFMRLPPELRIFVYERLAREYKTIDIQLTQSTSRVKVARSVTSTNILAASRTIRTEAHPIIQRTTSNFILPGSPLISNNGCFGSNVLVSAIMYEGLNFFLELARKVDTNFYPIPTETIERARTTVTSNLVSCQVAFTEDFSILHTQYLLAPVKLQPLGCGEPCSCFHNVRDRPESALASGNTSTSRIAHLAFAKGLDRLQFYAGPPHHAYSETS